MDKGKENTLDNQTSDIEAGSTNDLFTSSADAKKLNEQSETQESYITPQFVCESKTAEFLVKEKVQLPAGLEVDSKTLMSTQSGGYPKSENSTLTNM